MNPQSKIRRKKSSSEMSTLNNFKISVYNLCTIRILSVYYLCTISELFSKKLYAETEIENWASAVPSFKFIYNYPVICGPGISVGIATGYGLDGPGIESRWGAKFSPPVQIGPGAQPASCTRCTGFVPAAKSGRGVTLTPHPLLVP